MQVFYAPHIVRLSKPLGINFDIQYRLSGSSLASNVHYSSKIFGSGWLNAAGSLTADGPDAVKIRFDQFWVDADAKLRPELAQDDATAKWFDRVISSLGRVMFFEQLAAFPVLYLDSDLAVFRFPPLQSNIAVCRVTRPLLTS